MEVSIAPKSIESRQPTLEPGGSIFETDPASFTKWLSGNTSDSLRGRWRADSGHPIPRSLVHSPEVSHSPDLSEPADPQRIDIFSDFGHCAPLSTQPIDRETASWKNDDIRRERLVRLLAAQQAWYDAQEADAMNATALLNILEHHQTQWLQANSPEKQTL